MLYLKGQQLYTHPYPSEEGVKRSCLLAQNCKTGL